jgi:hypothetical protein
MLGGNDGMVGRTYRTIVALGRVVSKNAFSTFAQALLPEDYPKDMRNASNAYAMDRFAVKEQMKDTSVIYSGSPNPAWNLDQDSNAVMEPYQYPKRFFNTMRPNEIAYLFDKWYRTGASVVQACNALGALGVRSVTALPRPASPTVMTRISQHFRSSARRMCVVSN